MPASVSALPVVAPTSAPVSSPSTSSAPLNELGIPTNLPSLAAAINGPAGSSEPARGGSGGAADATNHAQPTAAPASEASPNGASAVQGQATQVSSPTSDSGISILSDLFKVPAAEVKPTGADKATPAPSVVPNGARVFDGLNEEESVMFKQMSNTAYAKLYPAYIEAKKQKDEFALKEAAFNTQLSEAQKARFYDHENAYVLDPDIQQLSKDVRTIEDLEDHFEKQLMNIEQGKPWQNVVTNDKGELQMTQALQPSIQDKVNIMRHLQGLAAQKQFKGAEVSQRINSFKNEFFSISEKITSLDNKIFGPIAKAIDPQADAFIKANFPKAVQNKPEIRALAKSVIVVDQLLKEVARLRSQPSAQPNAAALASGSPREGQFVTSGATPSNPAADRAALMQLIENVR